MVVASVIVSSYVFAVRAISSLILARTRPEYWDEFDIDYFKFATDSRDGESKRVRGQSTRAMTQNSVITTIHVIAAPDIIYSDFWFCSYEVDKIWPPPKPTIRLQRPWKKAVAIASPTPPGPPH